MAAVTGGMGRVTASDWLSREELLALLAARDASEAVMDARIDALLVQVGELTAQALWVPARVLSADDQRAVAGNSSGWASKVRLHPAAQK